MVGKPNEKIPTTTLHPIPVFEEPSSWVIVDYIGPLPRTKSGNKFLLTIMCASSKFLEAIPLQNISAKKIVKALNFFNKVGLAKVIQLDQGSNFMSRLFQQVVKQLGITSIEVSVYHPQSQELWTDFTPP